MKKVLFFLLTLLVASSVMAQTFEESQKRVDSDTSKLEKRLKQMSSREYKKRSRPQVYKMSEGSSNDINEPPKFRGLIINEKNGKRETAIFCISRIDIKNVPPVSFILRPGEKKEWFLPVGTYEVSMVCGSARTSLIFHVDPLVLNWFNSEQVYWGIKKNLFDW